MESHKYKPSLILTNLNYKKLLMNFGVFKINCFPLPDPQNVVLNICDSLSICDMDIRSDQKNISVVYLLVLDNSEYSKKISQDFITSQLYLLSRDKNRHIFNKDRNFGFNSLNSSSMP